MLTPAQGPSGGEVSLISVRGGAAGVAAHYAGMRGLASTYDRAGDRLRHQLTLGGRVLADADLVASALLSPLTFAEAEGAVLATTGGPDGLAVASLSWEADAVLVRVTVEAFETTDELVRVSFETVDYAVGRTVGSTLAGGLVATVATAPTWLPTVAAGAAGAAMLYAALPPPLQDRVRAAGGQVEDELAADLQAWLVDHPDLAQHLANGGGGLVDGFWDGLTPGAPLGPAGLPLATPTTQDAAGVLAGLYPDEGPPRVDPRDDLAGVSGEQPVPGGLADVMSHLDQVNAWSPTEQPGNNGTIEIQSWVGSDGVPHHIVYLPGTDDMATLPWTMDGDVRDMPTNFLAVDGQSTAYAEGILAAMHQAGISPADPVLLAGHSQGGIEAAWIAGHTRDFTIAQVVTAGSPVAGMPVPGTTQMLSLEHRGDVMPLLDGEDNPDAVNHVTVGFGSDDPAPDLADNHALEHYVRGAAGVDASTHPSLVAAVDGLHRGGFLTGETVDVTYQAFQISRAPR